jgi:molybdate/tungstate transport system ATP-binding protein
VEIRPEEIVISLDKISSSMRNSYQGKIMGINNHNFYYEVIVNVNDVPFTGLVTKGALVELGIEEGKMVYVSFKASAVHVF